MCIQSIILLVVISGSVAFDLSREVAELVARRPRFHDPGMRNLTENNAKSRSPNPVNNVFQLLLTHREHLHPGQTGL